MEAELLTSSSLLSLLGPTICFFLCGFFEAHNSALQTQSAENFLSRALLRNGTHILSLRQPMISCVLWLCACTVAALISEHRHTHSNCIVIFYTLYAMHVKFSFLIVSYQGLLVCCNSHKRFCSVGLLLVLFFTVLILVFYSLYQSLWFVTFHILMQVNKWKRKTIKSIKIQ